MQPPTPYYQQDGITIYCGDNRQVLPMLGRFDLVLTDPPFGVGNFVQVTGSLRGQEVTWNDSKPDDAVFDLIRDHSRHRIIWGANYLNWFEPPNGCIVWVKGQTLPNFSKAEVASCNFFKKTEVVEIDWNGAIAGQFKSSSHPCERPVALYTWCLRYAPEARTVLDPWMGSGTTLVAAKLRGLQATGIEINEDYCKIAVERLRQRVLITV